MKEKLNAKDLINVGIYSAIYFVIILAVAMLGMIPVMYPMLCVLCPLLGGIVFMLFLTKVKKFGMIWIMSVLMGLLMLLSGMSYYALIVSVFTGLAAELIYKSGEYKSANKGILTHAVFTLWVCANFGLYYFQHDEYIATRTEMMGQDYVDALTKIMFPGMWAVMIVVTFVFGLLGGVLGRKMLKKHLEKAGIA